MSSVVCSVSFESIKSPKIVSPQIRKFDPCRHHRFFEIFDRKLKLTKFSIILKLLLIYPVRTDKMSSVVCSVSFESIKSPKIVSPQIRKFDPCRHHRFFGIFDRKLKLTKFSIILKLLLIYPVRTDKMSSVVCSVSFEGIKSPKIVSPQIRNFDPCRHHRFLGIFDQKHKLAKFFKNLQLSLIYPLCIDKMSLVVSSVSFESVKSQKFVSPQIWKIYPCWHHRIRGIF